MRDKHLQLIAHCLVLVVIMLGLIAAGLWFRLDPADSRAQAQTSTPKGGSGDAGMVDLGKIRLQGVEQMETLNRRVADLERGLRDGSYVIQTIEAKGAAKPVRKEEPKE